MLRARKDLPAHTIDGLIQLTRRPEARKWSAVRGGHGSPFHLANEALQNADTRVAFEASGNTVVNPTSVADLNRIYRDEIDRYQAIAKSIRFEPQ